VTEANWTEEQLCATCKGQLWVCENHQDVPWNDGDPPCCAGAGAPCPTCNVPKDGSMPRPQPDSTVLWDLERGWLS